MGVEQDAIAWVQNYYASDPKLAVYDKEFGCLFWEENSKLKPDQMIWSPSYNEVRLYPLPVLVKIIEHRVKRLPSQYFGDFHSHPVSATWVGQLPSPDDLFEMTVAADYFELVAPINGVDSIRLSPRIQIILLLKFGDLIIAEPEPGRTPYPDLVTQKADLWHRRKAYEKWHRRADQRLGALPKGIPQADYRQQLSGIDSNQHVSCRTVFASYSLNFAFESPVARDRFPPILLRRSELDQRLAPCPVRVEILL